MTDKGVVQYRVAADLRAQDHHRDRDVVAADSADRGDAGDSAVCHMEAGVRPRYGQDGLLSRHVQSGHMRWIKNWPQLDEHIKQWKAEEESKTAADRLHPEHGRADSICGPIRSRNGSTSACASSARRTTRQSLWHGTSTEGGFFRAGPGLLREMNASA